MSNHIHECCQHHNNDNSSCKDKHEHNNKQSSNHNVHHHNEKCCCHHNHEHDSGCGCGCGHSNSSKNDSIILIIRIVISIVLLVGSMLLNGIVQYILLVLSYLIIAYDILISAFKNIIKGRLFDENFLMTLASLTAIIVYIVNKDAQIDGFDGVLVILLYQIGEFIQHKAVDKSKKSIMDMMELDVDKVILIDNEKEIIIKPEQLKVNDIIKILPGEKIPTDGVIIKGSSSINTSMLTGESKPIDVFENDLVSSGCINNDGVLIIKALTNVENSTSSKVMKMIKEASKNKSSSEKFITKFAKFYTPIVILISLIVIFVIPLILGFKENFYTYLYKGLAIMVISCPCALVISIPLSYFMAIGKSAKNSILVKGSSYIENLSKSKIIAFDKTGTLTKGNFKIDEIKSNNIQLMKSILYSCEKNFTHPIAKSICSYLNDINEIEISDLKNIPGYGLKAIYDNKEILIGNEKLLKENNVTFNKVFNVNTIIYVSYNKEYLGYVSICDEIKDDVLKTINSLKKINDIYLISGDSKEIVEDVAKKVEIDNYYHSQLPEDKVNIITNLKEKGNVVYVGDGINDAACLLNSDCGIAMKSLGSDIAITASDIVIMDDKVSNVEKAIKISKKTMKVVIINIVMSIMIKVAVMVLAMFLPLPIWIAIIADVGVCLLAILNSLTIMYGKYIK